MRIFVIGIIFNHTGLRTSFSDLLVSYASFHNALEGVTAEFKFTHRQLLSHLVERLHGVEEYTDLVASHVLIRQMIGIQNNHYRARGVRERRHPLPASTIASKSGSSLNRPASCSHQGRRAAFRTDFN